jgi:hypothetical protein
MRSIPPKRRFWRERWPAGHHNPHNNIVLRNVRVTPKAKMRDIELECSAGSRDSVDVYREGRYVYVLAVNRGLGYVGLAEYDLKGELTGTMGLRERPSGASRAYESLKPVGDVFIQADHEIESILGSRGLDLSETTMIRRLMPYLPH